MAKRKRIVTGIKEKKEVLGPINDGMNTPVPDAAVAHVSSESEAALFKQAENPLGDPHKI